MAGASPRAWPKRIGHRTLDASPPPPRPRASAPSCPRVVVGEGDRVRAVNDQGLAWNITHIPTGGAAPPKFPHGRELPADAVLLDPPKEGSTRIGPPKGPVEVAAPTGATRKR